jgi:hypothetical protein
VCEPWVRYMEWDPCEIKWFVDRKLVHRRAIWGPTPIPHSPMTLHGEYLANGMTRASGAAGLPALLVSAIVRRIGVDLYGPDNR